VLARMASVVERRNTIPILANIHIVSDGSELVISATDLETKLSETVPARCRGAGEITVSAPTLHKIASTLPHDSVITIQAHHGDSAGVTSDDFSAELFTIPAADFPDYKVGYFQNDFTIPAARLRRILDRVKYAISTDECRYYLNGVYLHALQDGNLKTIATDGHRLAVCTADGIAGVAGFPSMIIPRKVVGILLKLLAGTMADVTISQAGNGDRIKFDVGPISLMTKPIDGTYPDYESVIPRSNDRRLVVEKKAFLKGVAAVNAVGGLGGGRMVKLSLSASGSELSSQSVDAGSAKIKLNGATQYTGPDMELAIQASYLKATLAMAGDEVEFLISNSAGPVMVRSIPDDEVINVLMPMRV
jgi:DNA polymerase-3 subunit beta